jgi:anaerobic magnesium-protoporphyrin IX monomethyl ester cyclase
VAAAAAPAIALLDSDREVPAPVIVLLHPRSTRPKNRRFPLAPLSLAAVLEGREEYSIVDGNLDPHPEATLDALMREHRVELLAVSVMPGPQMKAAIPLCRHVRDRYPQIPIVWGGYFPSLYTDAALNAKYVDYAVRGQGEDALLELLEVVRGRRDRRDVRGLSFRDDFGFHVHNARRPLRAPDEFPPLPYHRLPQAERYIANTFLGRRTAVHHASIGCPFRCNFCGVVPIYEGRQKAESPERTAAALETLKQRFSIDSVQFYDNNFFLSAGHTARLAACLEPLRLNWWAEGRIDTVLKYPDDLMRSLRRAGAQMIFFGAESGSDWALREMNKQLTPEQTLELAARIRQFDIVPEFSFVVGNPHAPERDTSDTIRFIRRIKKLNPAAEIIVQHYIPTPHPDGMYGGVDGKVTFPSTPEEWASDRWYQFTTRQNPNVTWLPRRIQRRIDNFELVINSRWPTVQDIHLPGWGRAALKTLSSWRYALGVYGCPVELRALQRLVALRRPRLESL